MTAEKTSFTDNQKYTAVAATLALIEPSLKWNTAAGPNVTVGDVAVANDANVVCISEVSKSGTTFSISDVASGAKCRHVLQQGRVPGHGYSRYRRRRSWLVAIELDQSWQSKSIEVMQMSVAGPGGNSRACSRE